MVRAALLATFIVPAPLLNTLTASDAFAQSDADATADTSAPSQPDVSVRAESPPAESAKTPTAAPEASPSDTEKAGAEAKAEEAEATLTAPPAPSKTASQKSAEAPTEIREGARALPPSARKPKSRADDPYQGLDATGTPPPPPRDETVPEGKWEENYDGRRKKNRAEDALIWVPRAPLYPAHLVLNYGVRWPIVTAVTKAEEVRLFHRVEDLFTFADGDAGVFPIGFFDKGRDLWGGAHFFYKNLGQEGHTLRATAGAGTSSWLLASVTDSWSVFDGETGRIRFNATYSRDPTFAFTGLGPETSIRDQVFFAEEKLSGSVSLDVAYGELDRFEASISYKRARLDERARSPDLDASSFAPSFTSTTGFDEWYDLATLDLRWEIDTRSSERQFTPGSGVRWENWGSYNIGSADEHLSYFRYGTRPGVLFDITTENHVLSLSASIEALSKTSGGGPPLSETIALGGADLMKAFLPGRFRGQSALVYSAAYSWPVLAYADALLFADLGSAYLGFFDDFSHDKMVVDWGTGLRTSFSRDMRVELLMAWGSNRVALFDEGFTVDNFRFIAGIGRGF